MAQKLHILKCGFDFVNLADSLQPSRRRSLFTLSTAMIIFSSRAYNVLPLIPICKQMINDRAVCKIKIWSLILFICISFDYGRRIGTVQWWELSHWIIRSHVRSSLSTFAEECLSLVYPFPRPHLCGCLRHWVFLFSSFGYGWELPKQDFIGCLVWWVS
jgi:hypothetical protein